MTTTTDSTRLGNGNASEQTPMIYEVSWFVTEPEDGTVMDAGGIDAPYRVRITPGYSTFADIPKIIAMKHGYRPERVKIDSTRLIGYGA